MYYNQKQQSNYEFLNTNCEFLNTISKFNYEFLNTKSQYQRVLFVKLVFNTYICAKH